MKHVYDVISSMPEFDHLTIQCEACKEDVLIKYAVNELGRGLLCYGCWEKTSSTD